MKKFLGYALLAAFAAALFVPVVGAQEKGDKKADAKALFARMDTNKDEKLSLEEYSARAEGEEKKAAAKKRFETLDKNKDGFLNYEEFAAGTMKKKKDA